MTVTDPAFEGAGIDPGLKIWRIESFEVVSVPTSEYGNFYVGDSYIILSTKKTKSGGLEWDIHFWLGEETSQDEAGTAAIKSVELDDLLGGVPVQHREVQGHESSLFLSYFKKGIRYLQGGVKSGFNHVENIAVKRLLRVKGRRNVRLVEMAADISSMNSGDCFVLDVGEFVYVYVGAQSGRMERIKAIQAANAIRDDVHCGRSEVKIVDYNSSGSEFEEYFLQLGGGSADEVSEPISDDDAQFEAELEAKTVLYKIWEDDTGDLQVVMIAEKPLKQQYLLSDDCFLLDGGSNGLYIWIGKGSSKKERVGAMNLSSKYIEKKGYPKWLTCKRIVEGAEPPLFKSFFSEWKEPGLTLGRYSSADRSEESGDSDDKAYLHAKSCGNAYSFLPDDGSGDVEIWKVENFDMVPVNKSQHGIFFGGDSYVIKYSYGNYYVLYFWQGQNSSLDEKAASAMLTVKMDRELGGKATQVRVVHGQEPEHFLRIFRGKMVTLMGGHASGFKNIHDYDSYDTDGIRLFQVRGTADFNTRAEQIPETSSSLNSNDVFILETPAVTYIWIGKGSSDEEKAMAVQLIDTVSPEREVVEINEGSESEDFWSVLGGKSDYPETRALPSRPLLQPRLFKLSDGTGRIRMEEICNFTQEDLSEDDVMILDIGDAIYVWIGNGASQDERDESLSMTKHYLRCDPTDRTIDNTVIITIKQGAEPASFQCFFGEWNADLWKNLASL